MTDDRLDGAVKQGFGRVQDAAGGLVGDDKTQLKGKINEAAGSLQDTYGKVKDQAQAAVGQARDQAQDIYDQIEDYVNEQPLAALGITLGIGLVLGMLLNSGRKTIYVGK